MSTPIPDGSVVITPTEVYREMRDVHQAVRDVSQKLDSALSDHGRRLDSIDGPDGRLADHETRLRSMERRLWVGAGVCMAISAGASGLIATLVANR